MRVGILRVQLGLVDRGEISRLLQNVITLAYQRMPLPRGYRLKTQSRVTMVCSLSRLGTSEYYRLLERLYFPSFVHRFPQLQVVLVTRVSQFWCHK